MRERATRMILYAVLIAVVTLGVPGATFAGIFTWNSYRNTLSLRVENAANWVIRQTSNGSTLSETRLESYVNTVWRDVDAYVKVSVNSDYQVEVGQLPTGPVMESSFKSAEGVSINVTISALPAWRGILGMEVLFLAGMLFTVLIGWLIAQRMARKLSAPLIYLAAQAEQIGSGQVRARIKPSGVEEIDLVQEELARTGERMARRLAAERQRAADASHQLRTPLTALSMRIEEIQMISTEPEVRAEAEACLGQVERMTTVIADLLKSSRDQSATEALQILEVFNSEREEWESQFEAVGRRLAFVDESERPVLAEAGKLSQILAVLIENSLHYGAGTTTVRARNSSGSRGVLIDVSDEGEGISDDLAPEIFEMGVSGHKSSGIGLALAKDLAESMGGRLELAQRRPPTFALTLSAIPSAYAPDIVMPEGALISVGRRARRF